MPAAGREAILPVLQAELRAAPALGTPAPSLCSYTRQNDGASCLARDQRSCVRYVDPIPALKTQLARELVRLIGDANSTDAGFRIGADAWRVNDLRHGRLKRMSLETLIRYATRLGEHATITLGPKPLMPRPVHAPSKPTQGSG